ncbi:hypothetical protein PPIS_b0926 [Pseudoalteromonas piscicida]|uniref:Uncharacterized protein n=1 Tax=Pseudoalteromonas piscicida TaxID=43662 RepID=A0ABM6NLT0_PSEO7|nr:hypothetical protein PPIS_b0926 [Pseudoalteromonas piscicida]
MVDASSPRDVLIGLQGFKSQTEKTVVLLKRVLEYMFFTETSLQPIGG